MTVLIITGVDDIHADKVIAELERGDHPAKVVRLNTDNLTENCDYGILGEPWDGHVHLKDSNRTVRLSEVSSVWYRKPVPIRPPIGVAYEPARQFIADEYSAFLQSLIGLLEAAFWVSPYWAVRRAGQKLPNLQVAARLGFVTPRTIVTNDPKQALRFAEECSWKVIAKPFALTTFKESPEAKV